MQVKNSTFAVPVHSFSVVLAFFMLFLIVLIQSDLSRDLMLASFIACSCGQAVEGPLLNPSAFARLGLSRPRGVLLIGPPGCGKTSVALATAFGCKGSSVFSIGAADIYSPFVGDSEKLISSVSVSAAVS